MLIPYKLYSQTFHRSAQKAKLHLQEGSKKVLILGAGYVSAPVVDYLTRCKEVAVTVGKYVQYVQLLQSISYNNKIHIYKY